MGTSTQNGLYTYRKQEHPKSQENRINEVLIMARFFRERNTSDPVTLLFYEAKKVGTEQVLKPLPKLTAKVPMSVVKAILDHTIARSFYDRLIEDLKKRGVAQGITIQLRAKFDPSHKEISPDFKGILKLCEVDI